MQAARLAWSEAQPAMDLGKLVFIDETWAASNMTRSYGRASSGLWIAAENSVALEKA